MAMKILIADDHPIIRQVLKEIVASEPEMFVAGEAKDGDETLAMAHSIDWDVAVLDFSMPGCSGFDLLAQLRHDFPQRPVLILNSDEEALRAEQVLKAGGAGYLSKGSAPAELADAIRSAAVGGVHVTPAIAEVLALRLAEAASQPPHERLSDREYRVMWLITSGKRIDQIAEELALRPSAVKNCRTRVLRKLGLHNDAELVQYALQHQLIQ